jgi:23S rRNA pseudouridine955/2504/2580 synthase
MSRIQNKKTEVRYLVADSEQQQRRIDNFLGSVLKGLPRTRIYQMLRRGEIRVNGGRVKQGYRLQTGDRIRIPPVRLGSGQTPARPPDHLLELLRDKLIYQDRGLMVLNKPAGLAVHGGSGGSHGIIELLRCLYPGETGLQLVHRLDQDTSGCLLIARNAGTLRELHRALSSGQVHKTYQALLLGRLARPVMEVDQPLRKNQLRSGERMVRVDDQGKTARTRFEVLQRYASATLVHAILETGRTHQIRVHASYIGHPVAGDPKYGDRDFNKRLRGAGLKRMFLHASAIVLPPLPGRETGAFSAPLPDALQALLEQLEQSPR